MIDNNDMSDTIEVKSDQLNYSDFLGKESMIIKITKVEKNSGAQKATIHYENENGKPYKPSKGMRVAIILCWGKFKENWVGKSLELFGEPTVRWQGAEQGGIQIRSASHIEKDITFLLTISNKKRVPFTVKKLEVDKETKFDLESLKEGLKNCKDLDILTKNYKIAVGLCGNDEKAKEELKTCAGECKKLLEGK